MSSVTLTCNKNVSVSQSYPAKSYTASDRLAFGRGSANDEYRLLIDFPNVVSAIGGNKTISSATLTIPKTTGAIGSEAGFTAQVNTVADPWTAKATYDNQPGWASAYTQTAETGEGHSGNMIVDVTKTVKAWYAGTIDQNGFQIRKSTGNTATRIKCMRSLGATLNIAYETYTPPVTIRRSTFSTGAGSVTVNGTDVSLSVNVNASTASLTHDMAITMNGATKVLASKKTAAQLTSVTVESAWACGRIPNTTSGTAVLTLTTYNGASQVGQPYTANLTVKIGSAIKPSVGSLTAQQDDPVSGISANFQNVTRMLLTASGGAAGSGSSIKSYTFSGDGWMATKTVATSSASAVTPALSKAGSITYSVVATDARGRTSAAKTVTVTSRAYEVPSFDKSGCSVYRSDTGGAADLRNGTRIRVRVKADITGSAYGNQLASLKATILKADDQTALVTGANMVNETASLFGADDNPALTTADYTVTVTAEDKLGGKATYTANVRHAGRAINVSTGGSQNLPGVAFNGFATNNQFNCYLPAYFPSGLKPQTMEANFNMNNLVNEGFYDFGTTVVATNFPSALGSAAAVLVVKTGGTYLQQIVFPRNSSTAAVRLYDGSSWGSWMPLGTRAAASCIGVSSALAVTDQIKNVQLLNGSVNPFPSLYLTVTSTSGALQCNVDGYVLASGQAFVNGLTANDRIYLDIARERNGTATAQVSTRSRTPYADITCAIQPSLIQVQAGDVIRLRVRNDTASRGSVATGNASFLTVQYV